MFNHTHDLVHGSCAWIDPFRDGFGSGFDWRLASFTVLVSRLPQCWRDTVHSTQARRNPKAGSDEFVRRKFLRQKSRGEGLATPRAKRSRSSPRRIRSIHPDMHFGAVFVHDFHKRFLKILVHRTKRGRGARRAEEAAGRRCARQGRVPQSAAGQVRQRLPRLEGAPARDSHFRV